MKIFLSFWSKKDQGEFLRQKYFLDFLNTFENFCREKFRLIRDYTRKFWLGFSCSRPSFDRKGARPSVSKP